MARAADTGAGGGTPFVKFTDHGQTFVGAFGSAPRECKRQRRKYDTGEPLVKSDGKPMWEEVMYFITMPGTSASIGNLEMGYTPIEEGAEVRLSVSGFRWGQIIDARKDLPAHAGFKAGQPCSGDIYEITLIGWSAEAKDPARAKAAGFTVVENRIVLRDQESKDAYVLAQSRTGGNTNPAKDFTMTIRRPGPNDKRWEQDADALFDRKPWIRTEDASVETPHDAVDEPF